MIVVSDNSPLQYLVLIECINVLPALYGQVLTTPHVLEELRHKQTPEPVRAWIDSVPPWLRIESPSTIDFLDVLHIGEASAISLARQRRAALVLMDERAGTEAARSIGIPAIGTLGVLIEAGLEGHTDFEAAIERLCKSTPFYASKGLIESARGIYRKRIGNTGR
jgi:predicted nucleic acid-binding protein